MSFGGGACEGISHRDKLVWIHSEVAAWAWIEMTRNRSKAAQRNAPYVNLYFGFVYGPIRKVWTHLGINYALGEGFVVTKTPSHYSKTILSVLLVEGDTLTLLETALLWASEPAADLNLHTTALIRAFLNARLLFPLFCFQVSHSLHPKSSYGSISDSQRNILITMQMSFGSRWLRAFAILHFRVGKCN